MKTIEVDEDLYRYIASQTKNIGESASDILRRLLMTSHVAVDEVTPSFLSSSASPIRYEEDPINSTNNRIQTKPMQEVQCMLNSNEFIQENSAIGRFMMLLSYLYHIDKVAFSEAAELKGRKRIYFSKYKDVLLESGQTTKPKQIPNTPYWVISNTNTSRKQQIIQQLMERMGFQSEFIERVITTI